MVFVRETDSMLFAFSDRLLTWKKSEAGDAQDCLEEIKIPEPIVPDNLTKGQIEVIKKEKRSIIWVELSKNGDYIAVTTENKQLIVFDKTFKLIKNILLQRISSKVCFTPTNDILVADKTGDVYLYKMSDNENQPILLLGHLSMILDMVISDCGKYLITCDRDEKIRVSHYPNAYNIVTYCLGHTEFVTSIKLLKYRGILVSVSGDGTIRLWDYLNGKQIKVIDTKDLIDEEALKNFACQMDTEKVHVTSLPITGMQIYESDEQAEVAIMVSLYNIDKLFFYKLNKNSLDCTYYTTIDDLSTFAFHVSPFSNKLYIFLKDASLMVYQFVETLGISYLSGKFLSNLLEKYEELFNFDSDVTFLYKRQFDNVQEYMERKKQRLESK